MHTWQSLAVHRHTSPQPLWITHIPTFFGCRLVTVKLDLLLLQIALCFLKRWLHGDCSHSGEGGSGFTSETLSCLWELSRQLPTTPPHLDMNPTLTSLYSCVPSTAGNRFYFKEIALLHNTTNNANLYLYNTNLIQGRGKFFFRLDCWCWVQNSTSSVVGY